RKHGHEVVVIDQRVHQLTDRESVRQLIRSQAELVGFTVNYATLQTALRVSQLLTMSSAAAPVIVLGGEHATYLAEELLGEYACVDLIVGGEGEDGFLAVAECLGHGGDLASVRGISYRHPQSGACVRNPNRAVLSDLDELPFAARDVADYALEHGMPVEFGI